MGKVIVDISEYLLSNGRELKGPMKVRRNDEGKNETYQDTMGFGMTRSQLVNGLGASKEDLNRACREGVIDRCYVRLSGFSMELFYYARPSVAKVDRDDEIAKLPPVEEQIGLPSEVPTQDQVEA